MDAKVRDVSAASSGKRRFGGDGVPGSTPAGGGGVRGRRRWARGGRGRARTFTKTEGMFSSRGRAERRTARSAAPLGTLSAIAGLPCSGDVVMGREKALE